MGRILKDLFAVYTGLEPEPVTIKDENPEKNKWNHVLGLINHILANKPTVENQIPEIQKVDEKVIPENEMTIEEQAYFMDASHNLSLGLKKRLLDWKLNFSPASTKVKQFDLSKPRNSNYMSHEGKNTTFNTNNKIYNSLYSFNYLVKKGLRPEVAAGIVGNLYHENIANPGKTISDKGNTKSFGIACLNSKGRLPDYENFVRKNNLDYNSIDSQLDYIYNYVISNNNFEDPNITPEDASFLFGKHFEVFAGRNGKGYLDKTDPEHVKRSNTSRQLFDSYQKYAK